MVKDITIKPIVLKRSMTTLSSITGKTRMKILEVILDDLYNGQGMGLTITDLQKKMNLRQSLISGEIKMMVKSGVVIAKKASLPYRVHQQERFRMTNLYCINETKVRSIICAAYMLCDVAITRIAIVA